MQESSLLLSPLCAVVAGCSAEVATTPVEVTKVRAQTLAGRPSIPTVIASIYKQSGVAGFWGGLRPSLARQVLCSSAKFASYEPLKRATYSLTGRPLTEKAHLWQVSGNHINELSSIFTLG